MAKKKRAIPEFSLSLNKVPKFHKQLSLILVTITMPKWNKRLAKYIIQPIMIDLLSCAK